MSEAAPPPGDKWPLFPPTSASGCNLDEDGEVRLLIPLLVLVLELKPVEVLFVCNSSFPGTDDCRMTLEASISGRGLVAAAVGEPELILLAFPTFFRDLMGVIMLAEVAAAPPEASGGSTIAGSGFFGMAPAAL